MRIYYLTPRSQLKMKYRSDSLWGLICWGINDLYGKEMLESFISAYRAEQKPLLISSAFPFRISGKKRKIYLPTPLYPVFPEMPAQTSPENKMRILRERKAVAKVSFLSLEEFLSVASGSKSLRRALRSIVGLEAYNSSHAPTEMDHTRVQVTIDRLAGSVLEMEGSGQLFHEDAYGMATAMRPDKDERDPSGLYFFADGPELDKLDVVIRYLAQIGMGGNNSTGKGYFTVESEEFEFPEVENPNVMMTLSLYHPFQNGLVDELDAFGSSRYFSYELESRTGWTGLRGISKPATLMFREGSVFPFAKDRSAYGSIPELMNPYTDPRLEHAVYRYGMGMMIPLHLKQ